MYYSIASFETVMNMVDSEVAEYLRKAARLIHFKVYEIKFMKIVRQDETQYEFHKCYDS